MELWHCPRRGAPLPPLLVFMVWYWVVVLLLEEPVLCLPIKGGQRASNVTDSNIMGVPSSTSEEPSSSSPSPKSSHESSSHASKVTQGSATLASSPRAGHLDSNPFSRQSQPPSADRDEASEHVARNHRRTDELLHDLDHYEYVVPRLVDQSGSFVSYDVTAEHHRRQKRSTDSLHNDQWVFYHIAAFGMDFNLNLTLNRRFLAPSYAVEFWDGRGPEVRNPGITDCHFVGHVNSDRKPRVAISNCVGLHGMFATAREEYFVEPLWNDTRDMERDGRYHVVYRRSAIRTIHNKGYCGVSDKTDKPELPHHRWPSKSSWSFNELLKPHHHGYHHKDKWRERRRSTRSTSAERHVETLVVIDKQMLGYHGETGVEPYVLTVMNIVAKLYHDASIGNAINIIITRLVILRDTVDHLEISYHADRTLESFCAWQQYINPFEGSENIIHQGVAHHDNAILITRYDICAYKNAPCGTLGLAPVSGMCEPLRSCSINEDIGLSSAFTIAHEIGHNFGMQHDGVGNKCGTPGQEPARIMAAQLTDNTQPFSWSSCSKTYITDFLDSGRGSCLDDPPPEVDFDFPRRRPGEIHDAERQCIYQYGEKSRMCKPKEVCKKLSCTNHNGECVSNNIPAAEGSPCVRDNSRQGWCYRGKCEKAGYVPKPVEGGWGEWSAWGPCSRTCGGGVESSSRHCDTPAPTHGGKYCTGERTRYRSCNIDDCPLNAVDFRDIQCEIYNNITFRGQLYRWKPFVASGNVKPCALNCLAVDFNFYTEMSQKVTDGTKCFPDSPNICINGQCRHVGCDKVLGSSAVEDKCRVCDGQGESCDTIGGEHTKLFPEDSEAYKEIVTIPQGAVHIKVEEIVPSRNYLALKSKATDEYFINGAWTIDWPRKFTVANTVFNYMRPADEPEAFTALGPTAEDLIVMILLQEQNLGIRYEYNVPISNASHNGTEYVWQFTPWTECSKTCAKGIMQSSVVCIQKDNRKVINDKYCPSHLKPRGQVRTCNEERCPPEWELSAWSPCSVSCGGGVRNRSALCVEKFNDHDREVIELERCPAPEPTTREACNTQQCPAHWTTDRWRDCHPTCGDGHKRRRVYCVSHEGRYVQERHCDADKRPRNRAKCDLPACPPAEWSTGAWGECTAKCGIGQQQRSVACRLQSGAPSNDCDERRRPHDMQQCEGPCIFELGLECRDDRKVAYCPLVLKFKFCHRSYFYQMCCKTCSEHGFTVDPFS